MPISIDQTVFELHVFQLTNCQFVCLSICHPRLFCKCTISICLRSMTLFAAGMAVLDKKNKNGRKEVVLWHCVTLTYFVV